jgi:hypothetical protein
VHASIRNDRFNRVDGSHVFRVHSYSPSVV